MKNVKITQALGSMYSFCAVLYLQVGDRTENSMRYMSTLDMDTTPLLKSYLAEGEVVYLTKHFPWNT